MTASDNMSDVEKALRVNPHALDAKGQLKSFLQQYGEYSLIKVKDPTRIMEFTPFVLSLNGSVCGIPPLNDKPLILTVNALKHIEFKHGANVETLDKLNEELRGNILAYEDPKTPDHVDIVLCSSSENGNRIIAIVDATRVHEGIEINSLRRVHGKRELDKHILRAISLNRKIYVNKRTGDWLRNPRNLSADAELSSETRSRLTELLYDEGLIKSNDILLTGKVLDKESLDNPVHRCNDPIDSQLNAAAKSEIGGDENSIEKIADKEKNSEETDR